MFELSLTGVNLIDGQPSTEGAEQIRAENRLDGGYMEPEFPVATPGEIERAAVAAASDDDAYVKLGPTDRAAFLEAIATQIEALGDALIQRANKETALPVARLSGERARTCGQLRMFADLLREGSWVDARIDTTQPDRPSGPKPDIRRMLIPIGPVAVFGASNFPLAFSVAGGDTASALAAGCPVVVKAHPAHPGTSELVAKAILSAMKERDIPSGVFSILHGGAEVGRQLVLRNEIEAVGFTGSQKAGRALFDLAASRERPIPVYAEMGSVNPLFVLPGAVSEKVAHGYADSLNLGVGQFCTNPGVVVGLAGDAFDRFLEQVAERLSQAASGVMLYESIAKAYKTGVKSRSEDPRLRSLCGQESQAALFVVDGCEFLQSPDLAEELFGPAAIAVRCEDFDQMMAVAKALHGQLTATVHYTESDKPEAQGLFPILTKIAGRVIANGFPTGVEVCPSMQHGGPYPATTDSRSTSVGTAAILRFARPVAYQNLPNDLLPEALRDENPLGIWRLVDGLLTNHGAPFTPQ